ncbi:TY-Chap domain-containing protein [Streptodolium elevatio]|uniref:TY-Chap N-terminal domain-containing protein n=1 Tax=Streptodolium elevatio TaxID=3157996 RepID=A0ABV3DQP9_9ACTN
MEHALWDALSRPDHGGVPYIAHLVGDEGEPDNTRVRIGAPEAGPSVTLTRLDRFVVAEIRPADGQPLTEHQKRRLTAAEWHHGRSSVMPVPERVWSLSWRWFDDASVRGARGRAVVEALRDVLGLPSDDVVVRGTDDDGPTELYSLREFGDRPSTVGAPPECTEWDDLQHRLDWVLTTLATDAAVVMEGPDREVVQFMTSRHGGSVNTSLFDPELDTAKLPDASNPGSQRARRMFAIGWRPQECAPGMAEWTLGEPVVHWGAATVPAQAVAAARALDIPSPTALTVHAFRNGRGRPTDPAYVPTELGLREGAP